jgi:hypothetical protein
LRGWETVKILNALVCSIGYENLSSGCEELSAFWIIRPGISGKRTDVFPSRCYIILGFPQATCSACCLLNASLLTAGTALTAEDDGGVPPKRRATLV